MKCKKCGQEIDKKAVVCVHCGCKVKKPIYKKWWLWAIAVIVVVIAVNSSGGEETVSPSTVSSDTEATEEITYEVIDLQKMFDDLNSNAMKAENNYSNKYIEIKCKIKSFDSDGKYVTVEPTGADEWNFSTAMCYIKNDTQKSFLVEKNVGDIITIKGKIKSIGEVVGYSIDINEVF